MKIQGVYTALVTPFGQTGQGIDTTTLERLIQRQIDGGIQGIVIGGSTGEGQTMDQSELETALDCSLAFKSKIQIIGACGFSGTQATADRYEWLAKKKLDAVLVSTPPYNKAPQRGLVEHFKQIASRADTPIIVYNIPGRTAVNLLPESINELWKISTIAAVKESSGSIEQMQSILRTLPKDKALLCGDDPLNLSVWAIGGMGTVSVLSNVAPKAVSQLWKFWTEGNVREAAKLQSELSTITSLLFCESNPIPVKFAVGALTRSTLNPRLPLVPLDDKFRTGLANELKLLSTKKYCESL